MKSQGGQIRILKTNHSNYLTDIEDHRYLQRQISNNTTSSCTHISLLEVLLVLLTWDRIHDYSYLWNGEEIAFWSLWSLSIKKVWQLPSLLSWSPELSCKKSRLPCGREKLHEGVLGVQTPYGEWEEEALRPQIPSPEPRHSHHLPATAWETTSQGYKYGPADPQPTHGIMKHNKMLAYGVVCYKAI